MPRPPLGVPRTVERRRIRAVGGPAVGGHGTREHDRARQRVAERDPPGSELDETRRLRGFEARESEVGLPSAPGGPSGLNWPSAPGGPSGLNWPSALGRRSGTGRPPAVAQGARRGQDRLDCFGVGHGGRQQGPAGGLRQGVEPAADRPLEPCADRDLAADRARAEPRRLGGRLDERERVASRRRVQPCRGVLRHRPRRVRREQLPRRARGQAGEGQRVELGRLDRRRLPRPQGEHDRDRVGEQSPGREHERRGRRAVEPVDVVGQHDHRALLRERGQQAERAGAHELRLRGGGRREAERGVEGAGLRRGQPPELTERRPQQLGQAGERDLDLGLHPAHAQHGRVPGDLRRVLEQRALADPRLAAHHEHAARARPGVGHEPLDALALGSAAQQHATDPMPDQRSTGCGCQPGGWTSTSRPQRPSMSPPPAS